MTTSDAATVEPGTAFADAASLVSSAKHCALLTHLRADGDAIGSVAATQLTLRHRGIKATAMLFEPLAAKYAFVNEAAALTVWDPAASPALLAACDLWILADTAAAAQVEPLQPLLAARQSRLLVVDHHRTGDIRGDVSILDPGAASATQLLERWFNAVGWEIPAPAAKLLFMGLATDTGWFRFSNANAAAFESAARLLRRGVAANELHDRLHQVDPPQRFALFADACARISLLADNRLAVMHVTQQMFAAHRAAPDMTEDLVNEPFRIAGVEASVLLVESADGLIRVNFRGRGTLDVAKVAQQFGGGGHMSAAGARIADTLDNARTKVVAAMTSAL